MVSLIIANFIFLHITIIFFIAQIYHFNFHIYHLQNFFFIFNSSQIYPINSIQIENNLT
jgi:hypothetical protein